jgi:hypothetical protein
MSHLTLPKLRKLNKRILCSSSKWPNLCSNPYHVKFVGLFSKGMIFVFFYIKQFNFALVLRLLNIKLNFFLKVVIQLNKRLEILTLQTEIVEMLYP